MATNMLFSHPLTTHHTHPHAGIAYKYIHPLEFMRTHSPTSNETEIAEKKPLFPLKY